MIKKIHISAGAIEADAELNDTKTAQAIWDTLPIKGQGSRWGEEIYFSISPKLEAENAKEDVVPLFVGRSALPVDDDLSS